jgi:integrase
VGPSAPSALTAPSPFVEALSRPARAIGFKRPVPGHGQEGNQPSARLARRALTVFGKGQKGRTLPLRGRVVLELEAWSMTPLELVERTPEPDDFLLYPEKRTAGGRLLAAYPKRRLQPTSMHRWWYQRLGDADLVGAGVTSGLNMHRARHTFATELRRVAGIDAASQALGYSSLDTTLSIYGHHDLSDLERAMEALARAKR